MNLIKSFGLRALALVVSVVMVLVAGFATGESYDVRDPENCKLNFSILSDSHIEGNNFPRYKVYTHCLQDVRKNKSGNDAVIFLGDNTMNGQIIENTLFHGAAHMLLPGQKILPVVGNHDIGNGEGDYNKLQTRWYDYTRAFFGKDLEHPYYYDVIDGCYFIVLGIEEQLVYEMTMTEAQFAWLEDVLAKAADSGKPVFVFSHYPADDAQDENGNTDRLVKMLADFNKDHDLFYFCGHTHMPLYLFWSFHDSDGFPEIYLPRLTELAGADDHEVFGNTGIGIEVELYQNELLVRGRNFYTGQWRVDDEDDGTMCEMTYSLKNPIAG